VSALLRRADVLVEVVAPTRRWADAARSAAVVRSALPGLPAEVAEQPSEWAQSWLDADRAAVRVAEAAPVSPRSTEASVAAALLAAIPAGSLLFAGS